MKGMQRKWAANAWCLGNETGYVGVDQRGDEKLMSSVEKGFM